MFLLKSLMNASRTLHLKLFTSIIHAKQSFFDSTPLGRLMNRFSKDIQAIDMQMPNAYKNVILTFIEITSTMILVSVVVPLFLIVFVPIIVFFVFVQVNNRCKFALKNSKFIILISISMTKIYLSDL
jgi:ABC-type multidrug transport system fused ATPase/permease subunit